MARGLWKIAGCCVAVPLLVLGTVQTVVALAYEHYEVDRTFPAAEIGIVEIRNSAGGSVNVVGSDRDSIRVHGEITDGLRDTGHHERVEGDRLIISSSCPNFMSVHCLAEYDLEVPADVSVVISTDGHLAVSDVSGNISLNTDTGGIELTRATGVVQAHTDTGGITADDLRSRQVTATTDTGGVHLDFDVAPSAVVATTDTGGVEVVVPDDGTAYNVNADTDTGGRHVEVDTSAGAPRNIIATTDTGSVTVRYSSAG
jgi:hypothetical protein